MIKFRAHLLIIYIAMAAALTPTANAINWNNIRFGDETQDTLAMVTLMKEASRMELYSATKVTPGMRISFIGKKLLDTPYVAHTLECDTAYAFAHRSNDGTAGEVMTANLGALDCTTFVEMVMALAKTVGEGRSGWRDAIYNLEKIRYRHGTMDGYCSRLHYICDWVMDNSSMGIIEDVVRRIDNGVKYEVKTVDFMSAHRDRYPMLSDSATYARIREIENGYRNHRYGYVRSRSIGEKSVQAQFREGDILCFTSTLKDLDVTHLGILVRGDDGKWHVMHASSTQHKVVISKEPVEKFVQSNRAWTGMRILRMLE